MFFFWFLLPSNALTLLGLLFRELINFSTPFCVLNFLYSGSACWSWESSSGMFVFTYKLSQCILVKSPTCCVSSSSFGCFLSLFHSNLYTIAIYTVAFLVGLESFCGLWLLDSQHSFTQLFWIQFNFSIQLIRIFWCCLVHARCPVLFWKFIGLYILLKWFTGFGTCRIRILYARIVSNRIRNNSEMI